MGVGHGELIEKYITFIKSVTKRGLKLEDVTCTTFPVGWFGVARHGRRLIKIVCFATGDTVNIYARPLEGITMVVDLDSMEIAEYTDRMAEPVPGSAGTDYRWSKQRPPYGPRANPVTVVQPEGKGFEIKGHRIRWVIFFQAYLFFFFSRYLTARAQCDFQNK